MALAFSFGGIGTIFLSRNFKIFPWGTLLQSLSVCSLGARRFGRQPRHLQGDVLQGGR